MASTTYHIRIKYDGRKRTLVAREARSLDGAVTACLRRIGRPRAAVHDWSQRCAYVHPDGQQCRHHSKADRCWQHRSLN